MIKTVEADSEPSSRNLVCLCETHEKYKKVETPKGYTAFTKRRNENDKKGGGLMILVDEGLKASQISSESSDVLKINFNINGQDIKILLVYMDVSCNDRNIGIRAEIDGEISAEENSKMLILGDFNGHIGFLGGQQLDRNGKYVLDLLDKNMILLNADTECRGVYTREENNFKSAIDFLLTSESLYSSFIKMEIDEKKLKYDLSDHCLIKATFAFKDKSKKRHKRSEKIEYYCVKEENKIDFIGALEDKISGNGELNMLTFENILKQCADDLLKKSFLKKVDKVTDSADPVWFTKEIEDNIKERKRYNRLARNSENEETMKYWKDLYWNQKNKVKAMVKDAMTKYENQLTNEIKQNQNSRKMWQYINKLRRKDETIQDALFGEDGNKIDDDAVIDEVLMTYWTSVYQQHERLIENEWNEHERQVYADKLSRPENDRLDLNNFDPTDRNLQNWVEGLLGRLGRANLRNVEVIERGIEEGQRVDHRKRIPGVQNMVRVVFTEQEVEKHLRNIKGGKQPGLDGVKPELYKWMSESRVCICVITRSLNDLIGRGEIPEHWKQSKTVLIPKKSKPKASELRPISLNDTSYKLFMSLLKDKLFEHCKEQKCLLEAQAGFTKGKHIEDNVLILRYCIDETIRMKKKLYVTAIDFAKAFDSIKRSHIIKILKKYRCDTYLIDAVAQIYSNDRTQVWFQNRLVGSVEVKSGIRQGCTGSPWLFVMLMNEVVEKMMEMRIGFKNEKIILPILMFADDGLLIAQSEGHMKMMIRKVNDIAEELGMKINKDKSMIIIFNNTVDINEIEGIGVHQEIKYLGVKISTNKDIFKSHKQNKIESCKRLSNLTYSVTHRSCNKVQIGKTYWEHVALPSVLFGLPVVAWNKGEMDQLQREENKVMRFILGGPGYVAIAALRGELGMINMKTRDMKAKLKYVRSIMKGETGELTKKVFQDMYDKGRDKLVKTVCAYMNELDLDDMNELVNTTESELMKKIYDADKIKWRNEVGNLTTMETYRQYKNEIKQENLYDNTWESVLLFRARSNSLNLAWRRFGGGDGICCLCEGNYEETLLHFIEKCSAYEDLRQEHGLENRTISQILLFEEGCEEVRCKKYLLTAWRKRKNKLREMNSERVAN